MEADYKEDRMNRIYGMGNGVTAKYAKAKWRGKCQRQMNAIDTNGNQEDRMNRIFRRGRNGRTMNNVSRALTSAATG
jgi:hypothetical protein